MRAILHILKGQDASLALPAIEQQRHEPDTTVTVVLLHGAAPPLPHGVTVRRGDQDLTPAGLLELIFTSDQVITW